MTVRRLVLVNYDPAILDDSFNANGAERRSAASRGRAYRLTPASAIGMLPTFWAWADEDAKRIPLGELTITAGHGDVGKSTFVYWLIANVTRGTLPGHWHGTPQTCIITAPEDSWRRTINPRLVAAGADLAKVFRLDVATETSSEGISMSLPRDFQILEDAVNDVEAAIVFVDSLMSTVDIKLDTHKGRDARVALQPLGAIAERTNCSIIGNCHFNKASSSDAASRLLGSMEIRNVARAIIYFAVDREGNRVLSRGKGNLGRPWPPLSYEIIDASFTRGGVLYEPGKFVLGEVSDQTVEDILRAESRPGPVATKKAEAGYWLAEWMGAHDGRARAKETVMEAANAGFLKTTLHEARRNAGIRISKVGFGGSAVTWWLSPHVKTSLREHP